MKKFFLAGNNISHSLSPFIYNYLFKCYKIEAEYTAIEQNIASFPDFIINYKKNGYMGGNITMPFKIMAKYLVKNSAYDGESINLIYNDIAYNTDYLAIKNYANIENKNVLILGYGGAGQAIAKALSYKNKIFIKNRTINQDTGQNDIIINTTCCTMHGYDSSLILENLDFTNVKLIMDIVYYPLETDLLKKAKALQIKTLDGLHLLIWQAIESFKIFCNIDATTKISELYDILKKIYK